MIDRDGLRRRESEFHRGFAAINATLDAFQTQNWTPNHDETALITSRWTIFKWNSVSRHNRAYTVSHVFTVVRYIPSLFLLQLSFTRVGEAMVGVGRVLACKSKRTATINAAPLSAVGFCSRCIH